MFIPWRIDIKRLYIWIRWLYIQRNKLLYNYLFHTCIILIKILFIIFKLCNRTFIFRGYLFKECIFIYFLWTISFQFAFFISKIIYNHFIFSIYLCYLCYITRGHACTYIIILLYYNMLPYNSITYPYQSTIQYHTILE
jgi:hypothetical protein